MGLRIYGKKTSKYEWDYGYSKLHKTVRYLALKYCGMPDYIDYENKESSIVLYLSGYINPHVQLSSEKIKKFLNSIQLSGLYFPNIMIHSDCDGKYTKNGKCDPFNDEYLFSGNSIQLLKELEIIVKCQDFIDSKEEHIIEALKCTNIFYSIVKEEIENGCGTIIFR